MRLSSDTPSLADNRKVLEIALAQNRVIIHLLVTSKNCYKGKEFLNAAKLATSRSCRYFSASVFVSAGCTGYVCEVRSAEKALLAHSWDALELSLFGSSCVIFHRSVANWLKLQ